jgi:Ca2+-binding RTX toxin-like protein
MKRTLIITLAALLLLPTAASAATADADVERRQGAPFGPVTFKAAKGELNRVTVTVANGRLRFHDDRHRVRAKGDCEQVNASTAICPFTEDIATVKLGDRDDRASVEGLVEVLGGSGADVLRGSVGNDRLDGQGGPDTLRGKGNSDVLTGGNGRDFVDGGGGDDDLIDGETDRKAARDVYRGGSSRDSAGSDRGDQIFYELRGRDLDIDLSRGRVMKSAERDEIAGLESVAGGFGNDTLAGDGDDNLLDGNGGDDNLRGRGGDDIPMGGGGRDSVAGEGGDDVVWGNGGEDRQLTGGKGDDLLDGSDPNAETVSCGSGNDDARVTRLDTVEDCEIATKGSLYVQVQPQIDGNDATFRVACQKLGGCDGELVLTGPDGEDFGGGAFTDLPDDPQTFTPVSVTLTPAGVDAVARGAEVQVAFGDKGGYRAFMRSP